MTLLNTGVFSLSRFAAPCLWFPCIKTLYSFISWRNNRFLSFIFKCSGEKEQVVTQIKWFKSKTICVRGLVQFPSPFFSRHHSRLWCGEDFLAFGQWTSPTERLVLISVEPHLHSTWNNVLLDQIKSKTRVIYRRHKGALLWWYVAIKLYEEK